MRKLKKIWRYFNEKSGGNLYILVRFILREVVLLMVNLLWLIEPFYKVRIHRGQTNRIGHLSMYFEVLIRTKEIDLKDKRIKNIFIIKNSNIKENIANRELFEMWKKHLCFIESNILDFLYAISAKRLVRKKFFPPYRIQLGPVLKAKPTIRFSREQIKKGRVLCNNLGIKNNQWFVCLHNRESTFLSDRFSNKKFKKHDIRDCKLENFYKASALIEKRGGKSVRMYSGDKKPINKINNIKIIDYSSKARSEFMDIYLPSKCKFFLGNTSGLINVSKIFNVPCALTNSFPVNHNSIPQNSLFIPKLIWSKKENRGLSMKEIIKADIHKFIYNEDLEKIGLEIRENSPDDIALLTKDMFDLLDNIPLSKDDQSTRLNFMKKYFEQNQHLNNFNFKNHFKNAGTISWRFLKKHNYLMEK